MDEIQGARERVSLTIATFGDGALWGDALGDWFRFLGDKPGEVILVDMGSDAETQRAFRELQTQGMIDVLQIHEQGGADVPTQKETAYVYEYAAYALATKPYLLMVHLDTLPYRQGHDDWLARALEQLERPEVFAISGSFNFYAKEREAENGWYWSDKCSQNFALMKREMFFAATEEDMGAYVRSGFQGENPAHATGQDRYIVELAFEQYMARHKLRTLVKHEDPTWTIFHTNVRGARWAKTRADYLARKNILPYLDAGANPNLKHPSTALYYGQPHTGMVKRARIRFGQSRIGPAWRRLKQKLGVNL